MFCFYLHINAYIIWGVDQWLSTRSESWFDWKGWRYLGLVVYVVVWSTKFLEQKIPNPSVELLKLLTVQTVSGTEPLDQRDLNPESSSCSRASVWTDKVPEQTFTIYQTIYRKKKESFQSTFIWLYLWLPPSQIFCTFFFFFALPLLPTKLGLPICVSSTRLHGCEIQDCWFLIGIRCKIVNIVELAMKLIHCKMLTLRKRSEVRRRVPNFKYLFPLNEMISCLGATD